MSEHPQVDMLCFGAHPDDIEIIAGGTIIKHVQAGYKVGVIDMTRGETGTRGSMEQRKKELDAAGEVMGLTVRDNLALPDSRLMNDMEAKRVCAEAIRKYRPRVIIHQGSNNRHPDHRLTAEIVRDASFLSGLTNADITGEPHRPFKVIQNYNYTEFSKPSFVVDISEVFEQKLEAIAAYTSQFPRGEQKLAPHLGFGNVYEWVAARNRTFGMWIRAQYGEAFDVIETHQVDDLVTMPVASI